jgi:hypothetical protein
MCIYILYLYVYLSYVVPADEEASWASSEEESSCSSLEGLDRTAAKQALKRLVGGLSSIRFYICVFMMIYIYIYICLI